MRKIVVSEFITVDGVIQDPHLWTFEFWSDQTAQFKLNELVAADSLLLGRVTYEGFAAAWPSMTDEAGFADRMNGYPKYVVSKTLTEASWNNSTIINDDVVGVIAALKGQPGNDVLVFGSADLIQTLARHDLVDEYRLMVYPLLRGEGQRLFSETLDAKKLQLAGTEQLGNGVIVLTYAPIGPTE